MIYLWFNLQWENVHFVFFSAFNQNDRRLGLTVSLSGLLPLRLPVRKSGNRRCPSPCSPSRWRTACCGTGPAGSGSSGRSAAPRRWRGWGRRQRPPAARAWGRRRRRRRRRSRTRRQRRCCCRGHRPCSGGGEVRSVQFVPIPAYPWSSIFINHKSEKKDVCKTKIKHKISQSLFR